MDTIPDTFEDKGVGLMSRSICGVPDREGDAVDGPLAFRHDQVRGEDRRLEPDLGQPGDFGRAAAEDGVAAAVARLRGEVRGPGFAA
jgi:hypothetical protein